jgi:hypothetical protein
MEYFYIIMAIHDDKRPTITIIICRLCPATAADVGAVDGGVVSVLVVGDMVVLLLSPLLGIVLQAVMNDAPVPVTSVVYKMSSTICILTNIPVTPSGVVVIANP